MKNIITILSVALLLSLSFARTSGKYSMPDSFTQIKEVPKSEYVPGADSEDNSLKWKSSMNCKIIKLTDDGHIIIKLITNLLKDDHILTYGKKFITKRENPHQKTRCEARNAAFLKVFSTFCEKSSF